MPSWISGLASHEVYEIVDTFTWSKLGAFVLNVFLVVYLLWTKRLFGLCGGHAAFKAERDNIWLLKAEREKISLLEVERALAAR